MVLHMEFISLSAFIIMLRETMEAALIVGILLAYLTKTEKTEYRRDIWIGTFLAIIASIIGGKCRHRSVSHSHGSIWQTQQKTDKTRG